MLWKLSFTLFQVDPFLSTFKAFSTQKLSFPCSGDYIEVYRELGRELADVRVQVIFWWSFEIKWELVISLKVHGSVAMDGASASKRPDGAPLAAPMDRNRSGRSRKRKVASTNAPHL